MHRRSDRLDEASAMILDMHLGARLCYHLMTVGTRPLLYKTCHTTTEQNALHPHILLSYTLSATHLPQDKTLILQCSFVHSFIHSFIHSLTFEVSLLWGLADPQTCP